MNDELSAITVIASLFALIGLGVGIFALVGMSWVPQELVVEADEVFEGLVGLIIVALLLWMLGLFILFVNPLITLLVGIILGEFDYSPMSVTRVCAIGAFLGFFLMISLTVLGISVGLLLGAGTEGLRIGDTFSLDMAMIGVLSTMSILTAIFGGVAGFLGSQLTIGTTTP